MSENTIDPNIQAQLHATEHIVKALTPLDSDARSRVIAYACQLLGVTLGASSTQNQSIAFPPGVSPLVPALQASASNKFADNFV